LENTGKREDSRMSRIKSIGIIAEDDSDFESVKILIRKIIAKDKIPFKKAIGNGCGRLRRKACSYTVDLENRGCDLVILFHDLDRNNYQNLKRELEKSLHRVSTVKKFICIPIEELEAWFLSDPEGIKSALNLYKAPKVKKQPERIISPKEVLGEFIYLCSNKEKIYINTKHNEKISEHISIELVKQKCSSFKLLYEFLLLHRY
jgi:hypothetical protein